MRFVDSNIFIRYLTNDDPAKARDAFDLFQRVKRGEEVVRQGHVSRDDYDLAWAEARRLLASIAAGDFP